MIKSASPHGSVLIVFLCGVAVMFASPETEIALVASKRVRVSQSVEQARRLFVGSGLAL